MASKTNAKGIREISPTFLDALSQPCGVLRPITDAVKDSNGKFILCFRDNYINVYYRGHSILRVQEQKPPHQKYKIEFNLGHARFIASPDDIEAELKNIYPPIEVKRNPIRNRETGAITHKFTAVCYQQKAGPSLPFEALIEKYKYYIDDFFHVPEGKDNKRRDYFKDNSGDITTTARDLVEKQHQQKIFTDYNKLSTLGNHLVFYDMELSLPGKTTAGSPDCLAVTTNNGKVTGIVLVEVKSKKSACDGEHGIDKHSKDFRKIISDSKQMDKLHNSMRAAFRYYHALNMYSEVTDFCNRSECKFKIRFLFTAEAIEWAESRSQTEDYIAYQKLLNEDASSDDPDNWKQIELLRSL